MFFCCFQLGEFAQTHLKSRFNGNCYAMLLFLISDALTKLNEHILKYFVTIFTNKHTESLMVPHLQYKNCQTYRTNSSWWAQTKIFWDEVYSILYKDPNTLENGCVILQSAIYVFCCKTLLQFMLTEICQLSVGLHN